MATINSIVGPRTALTTTELDGGLASATYIVAGTINHTTNDPIDVLLEVAVKPNGIPASNKQVVVFAQKSLDGTNFETGPTSGTTTTDEPNLTFVGAVPCNSTSVQQRRIFSLSAAYGGSLPQQSKIILKNETGVALTAVAGDNDVFYSEVTGSSV